MSKQRRSPGNILPMLLCLGVLLIALAGCANATAAGVNPNGPTSLQATRINPNAYLKPPFQHTIDDAAAVQRLYAAALALPKTQPGVYNCPMDIGVKYQLRFLRNGTLLSAMTDDATSCEFLIIGGKDSRQTTPAFRALLAQTLGLTQLT